MKATVKKLCDMDRIAIPPELLKVELDEQAVTDAVARLSLRYAALGEAETAETGDIVHCRADARSYPDGRDILLYTDVAMPGAEQAAQAALGKRVGESFEAPVAGKAVQLTVSKIVRRTPAEVNDALIASMGLDGVSTVAEYTAYTREKMLADLRMERSKEITHIIVDTMDKESEFDCDAAVLDELVASQEEMYAADYAAAGIDITPEELRMSILAQARQAWVAEAFCIERGIEIDRESAEQYADQMIEMMTLMGEEVPERAVMLEMALENEYFRGFYDYIDGLIARRMGA